jgi:hypothetical protein
MEFRRKERTITIAASQKYKSGEVVQLLRQVDGVSGCVGEGGGREEANADSLRGSEEETRATICN